MKMDERPAVIARLYEVFARYPASRQTMSACSCCTSKAEMVALFAVPLAELSSEILRRYSYKAMTTWGSEAEWKHFLPRLCELSLQSKLNVEWIGNKFSYVEWREWPADEVAAVRDFWRESTASVARSNDWFYVNDWLEDLERLGESGEADLEMWLQSANSDEIFDLDAWSRQWQNLDSPLAQWLRRPEIENLMRQRL